IIAMANISDYDPNCFWKYDDFERKNRAITDSYEPGSTFKVFTFAALLEDKVCNENEHINTENGAYKFKNNYIRDSHKFESLTVRQILEESSNIGTAKLIQRMNDEKYYQYVRSFGFGTFTSIALPGEVTGKLVDLSQWSSLTKTYMSFGYNISVTPLQLTNAFCAIVNGGILYQPQIVKSLVDKNGKVIKENSPVIVRRVISEKTSERMRSILHGAVEKGTGKQARLDSIPVGGKTGTSKLVVNGKYSDSQYYSSFVGFYPVDNPSIVCYILIHKPKGEYYGGLVSAPVFKNIISRIHSLEKGKITLLTPDTEIKITEHLNQTIEKEYISQDFQLNNKLSESKTVFISTNNVKVMPDLKGKTIKEAVLTLNEKGIKWSLSGTGVVVEQSIPPGQTVDKKKTCILTCTQISTTGARIY
ncbi:MAG: transpeptidase family protein, partial [Ignavibacteria bacterium]|nr:transpeptidase family protein [Ignavibacteria bacterium]